MQRERRPHSRNFHQLASLRVELLARQSRRHADADYRRKIGLGVLQCRVIGMVGSQGPLTLRELCVGTDIEKTYASRLVAKLAALGLIKKLPDPSDQRSFVIAVTTAGRRTYDRIYRIAQARNESWLAALSPEQRETFFDCLDILASASRKLTGGSRPDSGSSHGRRHARTRSVGKVGRDIKLPEARSQHLVNGLEPPSRKQKVYR
jgi:DNA-binding MarR family transcriptional regulator